MTATVILTKCRQDGELFGIRAEKREDDDAVYYSITIPKRRA